MYRIIGKLYGEFTLYYFSPNNMEDSYKRIDCFTNQETKQVDNSAYSCKDDAQTRIDWILGKITVPVYINGKKREVNPNHLDLRVRE